MQLCSLQRLDAQQDTLLAGGQCCSLAMSRPARMWECGESGVLAQRACACCLGQLCSFAPCLSPFPGSCSCSLDVTLGTLIVQLRLSRC